MTVVRHRSQPVQFGAEKELKLTSIEAGPGKLAGTSHAGFQSSYFGDTVDGSLLHGQQTRPSREIGWDDLNDAGKAAYALRFRDTQGKFPKLQAKPGADYAKVAFEKNGWIELISTKFDDLSGLKGFLDDYGWGHVHISFMRGQPEPQQKETLSWLALSNVWSFVSALEDRGSGNGKEPNWRYAIKGLSIPTEEHMERFAGMMSGRNRPATAFAKHLVVNLRGNGRLYGDPNRIGIEIRGGVKKEKVVMLNSLLDGLADGGEGARMGSTPFAWGSVPFRLPRLGADVRRTTKGGLAQVKSVPRDFENMAREHLAAHPNPNLAADVPAKAFRYVSGATVAKGSTAARLERFDQRVCIPLLAYEALPFMAPEEKARAVEARGWFLSELSQQADQGLGPAEAGKAIAELTAQWARRARLDAPLRRYMAPREIRIP